MGTNITVNGDSVDTDLVGWRDLVASFTTGRVQGIAQPSWGAWNGTGIFTWQFPANNLKELVLPALHMNHDYKMGSAIFPHIHWMPETTNTGVVRWGLEISTAKGHGQEAFSTPVTIYIEQAASGTVHTHQVAEIPDPGLQIEGLEPDSLIMVRAFRDAAHANDTFTGAAHGLGMDIHYEADRAASINRAPNFYGRP